MTRFIDLSHDFADGMPGSTTTLPDDRLWGQDAYFATHPFRSRAALRDLIDGGAAPSPR